jgi:hypothetical protein
MRRRSRVDGEQAHIGHSTAKDVGTCSASSSKSNSEGSPLEANECELLDPSEI